MALPPKSHGKESSLPVVESPRSLRTPHKLRALSLSHRGPSAPPPRAPSNAGPLSSRQLGRKNTFADELVSGLDGVGVVDSENGNRCPAGSRASDKIRPVPPKVSLPTLPTRVKQPDVPACFRISARKIRPLVEVATRARDCEIGRFRAPSVLLCHDVFEVESESGCGLRQLAVLAGVVGTLPNLPLKILFHDVSGTAGLSTASGP
jgi:hypothetical protein